MKGSVRSDWQGALLVCRKCSKRLGGGFGPDGKTRLARVLRKAVGGKGRKASLGVVEVGCLDICPKGAVTLVDTRRPGEWLLVRPGADVAALVAGPGDQR